MIEKKGVVKTGEDVEKFFRAQERPVSHDVVNAVKEVLRDFPEHDLFLVVDSSLAGHPEAITSVKVVQCGSNKVVMDVFYPVEKNTTFIEK